jgi:hypothetical protein
MVSILRKGPRPGGAAVSGWWGHWCLQGLERDGKAVEGGNESTPLARGEKGGGAFGHVDPHVEHAGNLAQGPGHPRSLGRGVAQAQIGQPFAARVDGLPHPRDEPRHTAEQRHQRIRVDGGPLQGQGCATYSPRT